MNIQGSGDGHIDGSLSNSFIVHGGPDLLGIGKNKIKLN